MMLYGPQPQPQPSPSLLEGSSSLKKQSPLLPLPTVTTTKSTTTGTGRTGSKLPAASRILNTILSNYDHKLRPGIGEKPTVSLLRFCQQPWPYSIVDMEYTIDIIFYQTWYDERLRYNDTFETLVLNGNVASLLWIPDTFFRNSKRTQEHVITMPNQMVRIHKDGKVLYTIRMTIDAGCSLHMLKFPMDSHSCPLSFSSFSYTENEMIYKWENFKLEINEKNSWKLFQFDFTGVSNKTEIISTLLNFPRVSYITALDFYIAICFVFCFCALLEFAVLNFLTYNQTKAHSSPKLRHPPIGSRAYARTRARARARQQQEVFVCEIVTSEGSDGEERPSCSIRRSPSPGSPQRPRSLYSKLACYECCKGFKKYFCMVPDCEGSTWQRGRLCIHIYRLDNYSRVVFPVTFFFFNVLYWLVCLNL
uniref:Gamma-aminobutyric acid receptor subunit epsilon n=1 Tax=Castor canadensis TaxID=51338 RepID=A0A8B7WJQ0_CASCN|nr:gamma-aminobutyric acid receptor subunit epsilon [Castor canadensis]